MNQTVVVLIGNSDNKLTQSQWADYVTDVQVVIDRFNCDVKFQGAPPNWESWQNFCCVCLLDADEITDFKHELGTIRKKFKQDSIAILVGETEFIQ